MKIRTTRGKITKWLVEFAGFCLICGIGAGVSIHKGRIEKAQKLAETSSETVRHVTDETLTFPYTGTAGSLTLDNGYTVALDNGDAYSTGEDGQGIVDAARKALWANMHTYNAAGEEEGTVQAILDHDAGTPPALPAILESNTMWIKDSGGAITKYQKIQSVHTDDRATHDLYMEDGRNALDMSYIDTLAPRDKVVLFVTCEGTGRRITYWTPA